SPANAGWLKGILDKGELQWPQPLLDDKFKAARQDMDKHLKDAVRQAKANGRVGRATIRALKAAQRKLLDTLEANVNELSPAQYIESRRFLNLLGDAIKAMESPQASNFFNGSWKPQGENVAELVRFMRQRKLRFAPATPGDEPAYRALYKALT